MGIGFSDSKVSCYTESLYQKDFLNSEDYGRALILCNPYSGDKRAPETWKKLLRPMIKYSGLKYDYIETVTGTHIYELGRSHKKYTYIFLMGGDGSVFQFLKGTADSCITTDEFYQKLQNTYIGQIPFGTSNSFPTSIMKSMSVDDKSECDNLFCPVKHFDRMLKNIKESTYISINIQSACNKAFINSKNPQNFIYDLVQIAFGFPASLSKEYEKLTSYSAIIPKKILDAAAFFKASIQPQEAEIFIKPYDKEVNFEMTNYQDWPRGDDGFYLVPYRKFLMVSFKNLPWMTHSLSMNNKIPVADKEWVGCVLYQVDDIDVSRYKIFKMIQLFKEGHVNELIRDKNFMFLPIIEAHVKLFSDEDIITSGEYEHATALLDREFIVKVETTVKFL